MLGRDYRFVLDLGLVFQNSHGGQIVFHLLEASQHALLIGSNLKVVSGTRLIGEGMEPAGLEDGSDGRKSEGREAARPIEQGGDGGAFKSSGAAQADQRVIGGFRNAN